MSEMLFMTIAMSEHVNYLIHSNVWSTLLKTL